MNVTPIFTKSPDNLVFLDIETTGLDPLKGAKIVEIAMLKICDGVEQRYETLVNPRQTIPVECSKIHNINSDMVKNSPSFKEISQSILSFISYNNVVVCHNASFDLFFVHKELYQAGVPAKNILYIDTLKLAKQYLSFESNKLSHIANIIGVEVGISHRAMADVLTMAAVAKYIFANMYKKNIYILEPSIYKYSINK